MDRIDPDSVTWKVVKAWAEERLDLRRRSIESTGQAIDETENHRGAIEELRGLLRMGHPVPDKSGT